MKATAISAERVVPIEPELIPVGEYEGVWSGYEVTFEIAPEWYRLRVTNGIRGMSACTVRIDEDGVKVETMKP